MINEGDPPRLSVVAAIIDPGASGKSALQPAARLGSRYRRASDAGAAASATPTEQELAQALQGGQGQGDSADGDAAIAELLILADEVPQADELATGLSQVFLLPDHSEPDTTRRERRSAFADLYHRVALHQLSSQVRNKAAAIVALLRRP
jgi:hypothetical protein